jgi:GTP-binding protein
MKETEKNLALRVQETNSADQFLVFGRGILHLGVLVETMRREGYELQLGQPRVILKEIDGVRCEPIEILTVDVPDAHSGKVIEYVSQRKGEMLSMEPKGDMVRLEFEVPSRGLIGLRNNLLTATQGEAIMAHRFKAYEAYKGEIPGRINGVLISKEKGSSTGYSMDKLKDRGNYFIPTNSEIYAGQIVGEHIKPGDLVLNLCTAKQLTNFRAAGKDDSTVLAPPKVFSLEEAMEYIQGDEYVEVTPENIRLRKILLDENERKRASNKLETMS